MTELIRAAIAGVAILYLSGCVVTWAVMLIVVGTNREYVEQHERRRDRVALLLVAYVPAAVIVGLVTLALGLQYTAGRP